MSFRERIRAKKKELLRAASKLPMSGSEEMFTDFVYGSPKDIRNNNCYGMAIDAHLEVGNHKVQPGEISGTYTPRDDLTQCPLLRKRTLADLGKDGYLVDMDTPCKPGFYKISSMVDPGVDYHFAKQVGSAIVYAKGGQSSANMAREAGVNSSKVSSTNNIPKKGQEVLIWDSGIFCQKHGQSDVSCRDAKGVIITDPRKADWNFKNMGLNYRRQCDAFCVRVGFGKKAVEKLKKSGVV
jgi:hypothetical protein